MLNRLLLGLAVVTLSSASAGAEVLIGPAGPITGKMAWFGEQHQRAVYMAVSEINGHGGLLGHRLELIVADDFCNAEEAVAAANKLIAYGADVVIGHNCSGAAIPASRVYADVGVVMITGTATNPIITDQGYDQTFRMVARDTLQGEMAAVYLAERFSGRQIAILHDGEGYSQGLAEATRAELNRRSITEAVFEQITPGQADYSETLARLQEAGIDVGYQPQAALLIRKARDRGYDLQLVGRDALVTEHFWHVAGPAAVGVRFVSVADPRLNEAAAPVVERFSRRGLQAGGFRPVLLRRSAGLGPSGRRGGLLGSGRRAQSHAQPRVRYGAGPDRLRQGRRGFEPWSWYMWQADGTYVPLEEPAKEPKHRAGRR